MSPPLPSRRRVAFVGVCAAAGAAATGYRLLDGERGVFVYVPFAAFLLILAFEAYLWVEHGRESGG
ncbi:hypothetical protein [Candidatus Halobonum tyrrellensis]|uniref:Uncharacterized protein n=1 Tax=Candidatus Halobonum tyrrellensis G22 TaxID=1324957 RepID=V4HBQ5_9EURY|nr:hypothetical protein [Candidatus Halobonum tyrrellensis]ESP87478.1 hypothetical protein K933_13988 [Candidatus Halobonum tyrrellensis G22]